MGTSADMGHGLLAIDQQGFLALEDHIFRVIRSGLGLEPCVPSQPDTEGAVAGQLAIGDLFGLQDQLQVEVEGRLGVQSDQLDQQEERLAFGDRITVGGIQ